MNKPARIGVGSVRYDVAEKALARRKKRVLDLSVHQDPRKLAV
jgi:hypothetical protein